MEEDRTEDWEEVRRKQLMVQFSEPSLIVSGESKDIWYFHI